MNKTKTIKTTWWRNTWTKQRQLKHCDWSSITKPMNKTEPIKRLWLVINDETHEQNRQLKHCDWSPMTKPMKETETIKALPLVITDETHEQNRQLKHSDWSSMKCFATSSDQVSNFQDIQFSFIKQHQKLQITEKWSFSFLINVK